MEEETAHGYANKRKSPSNNIVDLVHLHTALQNCLVKYFKNGPRIRAFSIRDGATHEFLSLDCHDTSNMVIALLVIFMVNLMFPYKIM